MLRRRSTTTRRNARRDTRDHILYMTKTMFLKKRRNVLRRVKYFNLRSLKRVSTDLLSRLIHSIHHPLEINIHSHSNRSTNTTNITSTSLLFRLTVYGIGIRILSSILRRQTTRRRLLVIYHRLKTSLRINRISSEVIKNQRRVSTKQYLVLQHRGRRNRTRN